MEHGSNSSKINIEQTNNSEIQIQFPQRSLPFHYKDTVMPGEKEDDFRQIQTIRTRRCPDNNSSRFTPSSSSCGSPAIFPNRSLSEPRTYTTHRYNERKVVTRFAELTAVRASNEALHEMKKDTAWWRTERALTLYGNLENDTSEMLLPGNKHTIGNGTNEDSKVDEYESWITFRQTHECHTSIPHSHYDCAISEFQKNFKDILTPLDEEVVRLTKSIQKNVELAEEEFEKIIDAAYPTWTEVHPYFTKNSNSTGERSS